MDLIEFINQWRYERKYVITSLSKQEVEMIVKFHPAMFAEIFYERAVNNIYFDTTEYRNYFDNESGCSRRQKIRIRWYGNISNVVVKPTLEMKIKNNNLGGKIQYPLQEMQIQDSIDEDDIIHLIKSSHIPKQIKFALLNHEMKIINRYQRKYFQAKELDFRITLDSNIEYYKSFKKQYYLREKITDHRNIILELKYGNNAVDLASEISNCLPFRLTKNSKYINGIEHYM